MSQLYQMFNPLSDEQRIEARNHARAIVIKDAGDTPDRNAFNNHAQSKYPAWMSRLIIGLCLLVLAAAFAPSAIRLYNIGSTTFAAAIQDGPSATAAGLSIVLMAEAAQVLFSLAAAVMDTSKTAKRLLYLSMAGATILALVGNGQTSLPGHLDNPFAWLEALMPPLLVLSTAYILKEQMLSAIGQRHASEVAYQTELAAWKVATSSPERHPRYMSALANALKQMLIEENSRGTGAARRIEMMKLLEKPHWIQLVRREIESEQWYASEGSNELPELPALPETTPAPRRKKQEEAVQPETPVDPVEVIVIEEVVSPTEQPRPFGNTARPSAKAVRAAKGPVDLAFMPMTTPEIVNVSDASANGNGSHS